MMEICLQRQNYKIFIDYAFKKCDTFSFVISKEEFYGLKVEQTYVLNKNKISEVKLGYHPESGTFYVNSKLGLYHCNSETKSVLIAFNDIIDWDGINLPEELCFYSNGKKWFLYISHENYMFLFEPTIEDINFLVNNKISYHFLI